LVEEIDLNSQYYSLNRESFVLYKLLDGGKIDDWNNRGASIIRFPESFFFMNGPGKWNSARKEMYNNYP
jgi:hypothetical protein